MYLKVNYSVLLAAFLLLSTACKRQPQKGLPETRVSGTLTLLADATIAPLIDQEYEVFRLDYPQTSVTMKPADEGTLVEQLANDKVNVAVMARAPRETELKNYRVKEVAYDYDRIAVDAVAFVASARGADTTITTASLVQMLKGTARGNRYLLFDSKGSSLIKYLTAKYNLGEISGKQVKIAGGIKDQISRAAKDPDAVAVMGSIWLYSKDDAVRNAMQNLKPLWLGEEGKPASFAQPTTDNLLESKYLLIRNIYYVNAEKRDGLGTGFANFISSPRGQKIVYRSGIAPHELALREFNYIEKTK